MKLTEDELAYHAQVIEQVKIAEQMKQQITQAEGAFRSWAEHLHRKYELGEGEQVLEDGTIERARGDG